jgi:hypothetical protein
MPSQSFPASDPAAAFADVPANAPISVNVLAGDLTDRPSNPTAVTVPNASFRVNALTRISARVIDRDIIRS